MKPCIARLFSCTPGKLIVSTDGQNFLRALRCTNFWLSASQLLTLPSMRAFLESEAGIKNCKEENSMRSYHSFNSWRVLGMDGEDVGNEITFGIELECQ